MLEGLRGEDSIAELCREEEINQNLPVLLLEGIAGILSSTPTSRSAATTRGLFQVFGGYLEGVFYMILK